MTQEDRVLAPSLALTSPTLEEFQLPVGSGSLHDLGFLAFTLDQVEVS
jgi:hypothetical protein